MKYLQKLGKALMLPVSCMPICALLMGLGYLLCPAAMQGGEVTGLVAGICDLGAPYLVGSVLRNIVECLGLYAGVLGSYDSICCTVAAFALIAVEGLAYR